MYVPDSTPRITRTKATTSEENPKTKKDEGIALMSSRRGGTVRDSPKVESGLPTSNSLGSGDGFENWVPTNTGRRSY